MNPEKRRQGLVITELDEEKLVYDLDRHEAHCLNRTAAFVFDRCDGKTSVADMAGALEQAEAPTEPAGPRKAGARRRGSTDTSVVWLALERLDRAHLLEAPLAAESPRLSRRELVRRAAIFTGLVLPAVTSVVAPTPASAAATCVTSCAGPQPFGTPCSSTAPANCICTCDGAGNCVGGC
jgi:hypothetical protein